MSFFVYPETLSVFPFFIFNAIFDFYSAKAFFLWYNKFYETLRKEVPEKWHIALL